MRRIVSFRGRSGGLDGTSVPAAAGRTKLSRRALLGLLVLVLGLAGCYTPQGGAAGADVLLSERFLLGEIGPWLTETDDVGRTAIVDGQLLVEINAPQTMQFATLDEPRFTNFILEATVVQLAGSADSSYGLIFRQQDGRHFYRFDMTGNGLFVVEKHSDAAGWQRLSNGWVATGASAVGLNEINRLKVVAENDRFTFFINDQLVDQLRDDSYASGRIAVGAGTFAEPGLLVAFDDIVVRRR